MNETHLDLALNKYAKKDFYPFHMPGHKQTPLSFPEPYSIDITEIEDFDNLHNATGIILHSQKRATKLFGAVKSYFLVNGSTSGILSAISACVSRNGTLLMGRNSHKSVYHAVFLRQLNTIYLTPKISKFGIQGSISPACVLEAFEKYQNINAVFITSPTYDGVVSDIKEIADIAHSYNVPLIVDEAHGAHFKFSNFFPLSALECGADIVIQSLHKTLPSFTQTALIHINSNFINHSNLENFLSIYQTSSPSYLLMASIDRCLRFLEQDKMEYFKKFERNLDAFYLKCQSLKNINVYPPIHTSDANCFDRDASKILISMKNNQLTGNELYFILLRKYHLQMEMVSGHYVTALTSVMDQKIGFERLFHALSEIDQYSFKRNSESISNKKLLTNDIYHIPIKKMNIHQALEANGVNVKTNESIGKISQEYLYLYPPGIPVLVPGELITDKHISLFYLLKSHNLEIHGLLDPECSLIKIVNF